VSLTAIVFVIIYCVALLGAFTANPLCGWAAYLWVFYNHPPNRWWGEALPGIRWSYIAGLVALIAVLGKPRLTSRPGWLNNQAAWLLILYTMWMWIQIPIAVNYDHHIEGCMLFTKYVLLFFIIYQLAEDEIAYSLMLWGHVIGCFIFGWVAYGLEVDGRLESVGGPGVDDANTLAIHLTTGLAMAGFLFLQETTKRRALLLGLVPFILNGVIETQSRGALVALVAAAAVGLYLCPREYRGMTYRAAGLGVVLFLILANAEFWNRAQTIPIGDENEMEASAASRITVLRYGWTMFTDYPLGAGHRGHEALSPRYMPESLLSNGTRAAHNTFMQILVEQGIVGGVLYILLSVWVVRQLWRLKQMDAQGLSPGLALYRAGIGSALTIAFVGGLFGGFLKAEINIWLLAFLAALCTLCEKSVEAQQTEAPQGEEAEPAVVGQKKPRGLAIRLHPLHSRKSIL
jgi:O-antigen ligase